MKLAIKGCRFSQNSARIGGFPQASSMGFRFCFLHLLLFICFSRLMLILDLRVVAHSFVATSQFCLHHVEIPPAYRVCSGVCLLHDYLDAI